MALDLLDRSRPGRIVLSAVLAMLLTAAAPSQKHPLYLGADLSFVNELEDCGTVYRKAGKRVDPFALLKAQGGNLVRVRIWNDAKWTRYSNLADVRKTIHRSRAAGLQVLLDFHYSDDWADGDKQIAPTAWANLDVDSQVKALYDYTYATLAALDRDGLMPEMVQVGNETNPELLGKAEWRGRAVDWARNARLLNAGIKAVRDAGKVSTTKPKVMLHVAQPENVEPWFDHATAAGVLDYDLIGISYYRKWSKWSETQLGQTIARVKARYTANVLVVETAYPFTMRNADSSPNSLGPDSLTKSYPATPAGQRRYLIDLTHTVVDNGGVGLVYWEPGWVSSKCRTRWGVGSGWDNAALFDSHRRNEALPGFDFLHADYSRRAP